MSKEKVKNGETNESLVVTSYIIKIISIGVLFLFTLITSVRIEENYIRLGTG